MLHNDRSVDYTDDPRHGMRGYTRRNKNAFERDDYRYDVRNEDHISDRSGYRSNGNKQYSSDSRFDDFKSEERTVRSRLHCTKLDDGSSY